MSAPEHVLVPALVGLESADAQELALIARVAVVGLDPDHTIPAAGIVVAQKPRAGTQVRPGDPVTVWIDTDSNGGGGGGDGGGGGGGGGGGSGPRPDKPLPRDPAGVK